MRADAHAGEQRACRECRRRRRKLRRLVIRCEEAYFARHTSHVTRHTPHVTRHTSHVTRHTSHATRHTSPSFTLCSVQSARSRKSGSDDRTEEEKYSGAVRHDNCTRLLCSTGVSRLMVCRGCTRQVLGCRRLFQLHLRLCCCRRIFQPQIVRKKSLRKTYGCQRILFQSRR